jgi:hypothetical protein
VGETVVLQEPKVALEVDQLYDDASLAPPSD